MSTITGVFVSPERIEVIKARVARGAARLDEVKPDWRSKVSVARLDMEDSYQCVLGQAFWSYGHGLVCLEIQAGEGSVQHGFILAGTEMVELYPEALEPSAEEEQEILTALWVEEINKGERERHMNTDTTDTVVTLTSDRIDLLRRRVRAGAEMLDAKSPGWWELIDFSRLDIQDGSDCILGQVFGEYHDACRALDLSLPYTSMMGADRAPRLFGFNVGTMELYDLYRWERGHGEEILTSAFNAEATALKDLWMAAVRTRAAYAV